MKKKFNFETKFAKYARISRGIFNENFSKDYLIEKDMFYQALRCPKCQRCMSLSNNKRNSNVKTENAEKTFLYMNIT